MSKLFETLRKICENFRNFLYKNEKIGRIKMIRSSEYSLKMRLDDLGNIKFYINKKLQIKLVNENLTNDAFEKILLLWEIFRKGEGYLKGIHVFVDGSFMNGKIGYGFLIIKDSNILKKSFGRINDNRNVEHLRLKNVLGEIKAIIKALNFCKLNKWKEVYLHYDYEGLKKWATMEWRANNEITKKYQNYISNISKELKINWIKEKAHGDSMLNAFVDKLAKKATKL